MFSVIYSNYYVFLAWQRMWFMPFSIAGLAKEMALTDQPWNLTMLSGPTQQPEPGTDTKCPLGSDHMHALLLAKSELLDRLDGGLRNLLLTLFELSTKALCM